MKLFKNQPELLALSAQEFSSQLGKYTDRQLQYVADFYSTSKDGAAMIVAPTIVPALVKDFCPLSIVVISSEKLRGRSHCSNKCWNFNRVVASGTSY